MNEKNEKNETDVMKKNSQDIDDDMLEKIIF